MQQRITPTNDIEVDLGRYLRPIFGRWKILLSLMLACGLLGMALSIAAPSGYEAVATIAIVKTRTDVQFDPKIRTIQPVDAGTSVNETRRNALIGLVNNSAIAAKVVQRFGDRMTEAEKDPARLMQRVKGDTLTRSDLILIKVQNQDPELAAEIATFWAREYELLANSIYAGTSPEYLSLIRNELARAKSEMDQAQKTLTDFIGSNEIDALRLRIASHARLVDSVEASQLAPSLSALQRAQSALASVGALTESQQRVRQLRTLAATMRDQVRSGGDSAAVSNVVPLINLKMQVYAVVGSRTTSREEPENTTSTSEKTANAQNLKQLAPEAPAATRVDISPAQIPVLQVMLNQPTVPITAELQIQDLDALVVALDKLDGELGTAVQTAEREAGQIVPIANTDNAEVLTASSTALKELRADRAELERQEQQLARLTEARDLTVNTFKSLSAKLSEVEVSNAVSNREVSLASEAVPPVTRVTGRLVPIAAGIGLGLILGSLLALIAAARAGDFRKPTLS